jgi:carboxyl-terminal processing protease
VGASIRRTLAIITLAVLAYGGFHWGRALGSHASRPRVPGLPNLSRMLSANANGAMGENDFGGQGDAQVPPVHIFEDVLEKVQREYVESISNTARLSNGALARMFASLDDPRTYFLEPKLRKVRQDALAGRHQGIGAALTITKSKRGEIEYRHLTVIAVMPDSPAEKAGLRTGDHLTEVDGRWIINYSAVADLEKLDKTKPDVLERKEGLKRIKDKFQKGLLFSKALNLLVTGEGRAMKLTVQRAGQAAPFKVEMTTAVTQVDPVEYRTLNNRVGYLRIRQFNRQSALEVQEALASVDGSVKGLILDLRRNPGGVMAESLREVDGFEPARALIARLTPGGKVAMIEHKPKQKTPLTVTGQGRPLTVPLIVLVDQGTAGLSELVASALRDAGKAKLVGARTFGEPMLPLFTVFKNGSGVEMTTARLFTASGADLGQGLTPDIAVAKDAGEDAALQRALTLLGV